MRSPKRFLRFSNAAASHDGKHFAVYVETDDDTVLDLEIPIEEMGDIVQFLVDVANHVDADARHEQRQYSPIPIRGLGLATGRTPDETLLIIRLAGFELAFQLDSKHVAELGEDFGRMANTLSASGPPQ